MRNRITQHVFVVQVQLLNYTCTPLKASSFRHNLQTFFVMSKFSLVGGPKLIGYNLSSAIFKQRAPF